MRLATVVGSIIRAHARGAEMQGNRFCFTTAKSAEGATDRKTGNGCGRAVFVTDSASL